MSVAALGALWYGSSATGFVRLGPAEPEKLAQLLPPMLGPGTFDLLGVRHGLVYLFHRTGGTILTVPAAAANASLRVVARPLALVGATGLGLLGESAILLSPRYLPRGENGTSAENTASRLWSVPLAGGQPRDMGFPPLGRGAAWVTASACFGIRAGREPGPEIWVADGDNSAPRATAMMSARRPWEYDPDHRLPGKDGTYFSLFEDSILYVPPNGGSVKAALRSEARLVSEIDDRLLWAQNDRMSGNPAETIYSTRRDCTDPRVLFQLTPPAGTGQFLRSVVTRGGTWYGIIIESTGQSDEPHRHWMVRLHPYSKQPIEQLVMLPADRLSERFDSGGFYYVATEEQTTTAALPPGLGVRRATNLYRFALPDS